MVTPLARNAEVGPSSRFESFVSCRLASSR